jgi:hypothetical protein
MGKRMVLVVGATKSMQNLDRNPPTQVGVEGEVDATHAAFTQKFEHQVAANLLSNVSLLQPGALPRLTTCLALGTGNRVVSASRHGLLRRRRAASSHRSPRLNVDAPIRHLPQFFGTRCGIAQPPHRISPCGLTFLSLAKCQQTPLK